MTEIIVPESEVFDFVARCNKLIAEYMAEKFPGQEKTLTYKMGRKYAKVIVESGVHSKAVWAFIDLTTGDILKPASWRAPAKGARGNLFDESEGMAHIGPYGPAYLR